MPEVQRVTLDLDQLGPLRGRQIGYGTAQEFGRPQDDAKLLGVVRGSHQQQQPGRLGKQGDLRGEGTLHPAGHRQRAQVGSGWVEPPGALVKGQRRWQFHQRQRVPLADLDDPVAGRGGQVGGVLVEQMGRVIAIQRFERDARQIGRVV